MTTHLCLAPSLLFSSVTMAKWKPEKHYCSICKGTTWHSVDDKGSLMCSLCGTKKVKRRTLPRPHPIEECFAY